MKRVMLGILILIVTALTADAAQAQAWRHVPKVVVVSPAGNSRLRAVDEAVAFWNSTLQQMGSGFRLGPVMRMVRPIPEEALQQLSGSVLGSRGRTANFSAALRDLPGDITISSPSPSSCRSPARSTRMANGLSASAGPASRP